jgi:hypothetical protein
MSPQRSPQHPPHSVHMPRFCWREDVSRQRPNLRRVAPPPGAGDTKLNKIVDDISGLTLLQAADLVSLLKVSV